MLTIIHVNGPINSGKTSVGKALADLLPNAAFIDGDDHDAPDDAPLAIRVEAALARIENEIAKAWGSFLVVAYPLEIQDYERLRNKADKRGSRFFVLTLAPPLEVALMNRGERTLAASERQRILEMYREGYHTRPFSDASLDTTGLTPLESAARAVDLIRRAPAS
ncbi:shikimate kinase [Microvirga rosea]|uniref:shikimate kinase n=1 Tax=Microvirga rosea TaxID=2715425 RepID=UPI001D0AF8F8|nr:shikimate kinase [Microvirga rosea]MCB8821799.1 shikimate kinase [Microvirga rosea]